MDALDAQLAAMKRESREKAKVEQCAGLVIELRLAQGRVLADSHKGAPLYLVDDLTAELDEGHALQVCRLLEQTNSQVVLTTVSELAQERSWMQGVTSVFHVEQGCVSKVVSSTDDSAAR